MEVGVDGGVVTVEDGAVVVVVVTGVNKGMASEEEVVVAEVVVTESSAVVVVVKMEVGFNDFFFSKNTKNMKNYYLKIFIFSIFLPFGIFFNTSGSKCCK